LSRLAGCGKIFSDNFAALGGINSPLPFCFAFACLSADRRSKTKQQGLIEGVKGFDLGVRVKVACRGRRVGRDNNPCKNQTLKTRMIV